MKSHQIWLSFVALVGTLMLNIGLGLAAQHEHSKNEQMLKVGKKGDVTFRNRTQVGDIFLEPGRYILQHRTAGEAHSMHFTHYIKSSLIGHTPRGNRIVPSGNVQCRLEPLSDEVQSTTLQYSTGGGVYRLSRVEIAGENVAHLF